MYPDHSKDKNLAKSLLSKNKITEAQTLLLDICRQSADAESLCMLASTYISQSNYLPAEQCLLQAVQSNPDSAEAWGHLGILQSMKGDYHRALSSYKKSLSISPRNIQTLNNMGNLYRELGNYDAAEDCYRQSLQLDRKNFITINNIANIYLTKCQYEIAEKYYKEAIKLNKNYFDAHYNLGATYQSRGDHKSALKYYRLAQRIQPDNYSPRVAIANSYEKQGEYDKALSQLEPLIKKNIISPDIADVYSKVCIKNKNYDDAEEVIKKCLSGNISPIHEQALRFNLGDIYDKKELYDEAFEQYRLANNMRPYKYSKEACEKAFQAIIDTFRETGKETSTSENKSNQPLFILGMPRSGTTLVEQILTSHSNVSGAGELPLIGEIAESKLSNNTQLQPYPINVKSISREVLNACADYYLKQTQKLAGNSIHITDKMPHNFLYIGIIRMLFPNAKIIHCLRNPLDVCLSIYFHNFNQNHPYSDKLENLGHYYNQYRRLMEFWDSIYPGLTLDMQYEDLLSDPKSHIENMLSHVNLDWEDNCLEFHKNKRVVSTPSYAQVTQPIYTSSLARWKHYANHIENLKNAIDDKYLLKDHY